MIFGLEQEGGSLIAPLALAHPLHPIHNRSRNKHRNLWVGRCVSSWWPWFPSRSSVLIIYMHSLYVFCYRTYIYIYIYTYIFVVVNFDALAQASDFRIERRQVVFLCWEQDSNPGPQTPIRQQTDRWQTDWAIEDQAKKLELDSPSLWSASIQPTWPHCQLTFAPGSGDIHICCC